MLMINVTTIFLQNNNIDGVVFLQSDCNNTSNYLNLIPINETQYTNDISNLFQPYLTYPLHNISDVEVWAVVSHRRYEVTDWNKTRRCIPEKYIREDSRQVATTLVLPAIYHNFSRGTMLSAYKALYPGQPGPYDCNDNKSQLDERSKYIDGDISVSINYNNSVLNSCWKDTSDTLIDSYKQCISEHQSGSEYLQYKSRCNNQCSNVGECMDDCLETYFSQFCVKPVDKKRLLLYSSDAIKETYNTGSEGVANIYDKIGFVLKVEKWIWNFISATITLSLLRAFIIIRGGQILIQLWYDAAFAKNLDIRKFERFMKIGNGIFSTLLKIGYGFLFSMLETILTKRCSYENETLQCGMNTKITETPLNFTNIQLMYSIFDQLFIAFTPSFIFISVNIFIFMIILSRWERSVNFKEEDRNFLIFMFSPIAMIYVLLNFICNGVAGILSILLIVASPVCILLYLVTIIILNLYNIFWTIANGYGFLVFNFILEIPRLRNIEFPSLGVLYSPNFWMLFRDASIFLFIIIDLTSAIKSTNINNLKFNTNPLLLFVTGSVVALNLADYYRIVDLSHTTFSVIFILLVILPQPLVLAMEYLKKRCSDDTGGDVAKKGVTLNVV